VLLLFCAVDLHGQSKSITRFREDYKENTNLFFYSSTLKMLNTDNNPDLADLLQDIEEIRVLNYEKSKQAFNREDIKKLTEEMTAEGYVNLMQMNEQGSRIMLYSREKRGKTVGFVALVDNSESLILIDLIGSIDVKKFLDLKQRLDVSMKRTS
jgi:hypothetical protein